MAESTLNRELYYCLQHIRVLSKPYFLLTKNMESHLRETYALACPRCSRIAPRTAVARASVCSGVRLATRLLITENVLSVSAILWSGLKLSLKSEMRSVMAPLTASLRESICSGVRLVFACSIRSRIALPITSSLAACSGVRSALIWVRRSRTASLVA